MDNVSHLPTGIREQVERANALLQQQPQNTAPAVAHTQVQEEANRDTVVQGVTFAQTQSTPLPETSSSAQSDFKAQYQTLQGKYNKEVVDVQARNRILNDELRRLTDELYAERQQNETLQKQLNGKKEVPATTESIPQQVIDSLKEYGEEFVPVVDTINRSIKETNDLKQQITSANKDIELLRKEKQIEQYNNTLSNAVAEKGYQIQTMIADPEFKKWINDYMTGSRYTRLELLQDAESRMDANGVARFFTEYIESRQPNLNNTNAGSQQEIIQPSSITPPMSSRPVPLSPGANIQPPVTQPNYPTTDNTLKPRYTNQSIKDFYVSKARNAWRGREAEAEAIERDIIAAEGRIVR
jgi:hypothetical protein